MGDDTQSLFWNLKMKEQLKNMFVAIACGVSLSSCVNYSETQTDYSPFDNRKEFLFAVESYKLGKVSGGEWGDLELRKINGSNLEAVLDGIDFKNKNVECGINLIRRNISNFDSLDELHKASEIYSFLRDDFSYAQNPFDKLQFVSDDVFYKEKMKGILKEVRLGGLKTQTINETYKYKKGDCDALSSLLASNFISVGIASRLVLVRSKKPEKGSEDYAHVVVFFENGLVDENGQPCGNIVDPSYFKEKNFIENIVFSSEYLNSENFNINFLN